MNAFRNWFAPRRNTRHAPKARLQLENLETRFCPASIKITGSLVEIFGDGAADTIAVRDDGVGAVSVNVTSPKGNASATANHINQVKIYAGGGDDVITYGLTSALTTDRSLKLAGGKGNDAVTFDFGPGVNGAKLDMDVDSGDGNTQISMRFGAVTHGALVNVSECLGAGTDIARLNFDGGVDNATVRTVVNGGRGADEVRESFGDLTHNANVTARMYMGAGNDTASLVFGRVSGSQVETRMDAGTGPGRNREAFGAITNDSHVTVRQNLGDGTSSDALDFSDGFSDATFHAIVNAGKGNHAIAARFGDIRATDFLFEGNLGDGSQNFDATVNGNVSGHPKVRFDLDTGSGNDSVGFHMMGDIAAGAYLELRMDSGTGTKNLAVDYDGVVKGTLDVAARSVYCPSTIAENLTAEAGSTGNILARVKGSSGNDNLTLNVFDKSGGAGHASTLALLDALIEGNGGHDTIVHTSNVRVKP